MSHLLIFEEKKNLMIKWSLKKNLKPTQKKKTIQLRFAKVQNQRHSSNNTTAEYAIL